MPASDASPRRYRFGPLERRGLVAGWRGGQIGAVAAALVMAVGVLRAWASPVGVVLALAALAVGVGIATWPIAGRTAEEWAPDALRHTIALGRRPRGRTSPFAGVHLIRVDLSVPRAGRAGPGPAHSSTPLSGGHLVDDRRSAGVLHDRSRRTFTAVLEASSPGFVLLGEDDKASRVSAWSGVLASLARQGSSVYRAQWVERVVHTDEIRGAARLRAGEEGVGHDAARASYDALLEAESDASLRHEVFLALTIHAGRTGRAVKAAGGGDVGACAVLLREVAALRRRLADASVDVGAVLTPDALAGVLRGAYDDRRRPHGTPRWLHRSRAASWPQGRVSAPVSSEESGPWPMGVETHWSRLRVDGTWHATYWVAEWPRTDVGPDFLGPLLLSSEVRRTVSVVLEPVGPLEASRKVEQARTADIADAELRRRGGFLATARRRREEEILVRREVELADGHAQYRFSGYVTVSAAEPDLLEEACGRVEQAAGQAGLELRRCYGDQANAFLCTLPLGRGLS